MVNEFRHLERAYRVGDSGLMAGGTPFDGYGPIDRLRFGELREAGVSTIVCLLERHEYRESGESVSRALDRDGVEGRFFAYPVPDMSVPRADLVAEIIERVDSELAWGRKVYLHCYGGRGRTGSVVGCWLVEREGVDGERALERIRELRDAAGVGEDPSPETPEQEALVRGWTRRAVAVSH